MSKLIELGTEYFHGTKPAVLTPCPLCGMKLEQNADGTFPKHRPDFGRKLLCLGPAPAAIAVPEPQPTNPWAIKGRTEKIRRMIARLDAHVCRQATAADAVTEAGHAAIVAGETKRPSDETIKALADALLVREVAR